MNTADLAAELIRLAEVLEARPPDPAHWAHEGTPATFLRDLAQLATLDERAFWRGLDSGTLWAGIGSVANQALASNPGLAEPAWQAQQAQLRAGLASVARALRERAAAEGRVVHPDLDFWLSIFEASAA